jgi:putative membrane protein
LGLILNFVVIIGFVIGIILLIIWIVRRISSDAGGFGSRQVTEGLNLSSREILDIRYARGEIEREQYQQMISDLT